jgi:hypothetical protein
MQRMPPARLPESKSPSSEETLWQEPMMVDGTFHRTVSPGWIVTDAGL